jgi:S1-C subfamily serine protease
MTPACRTKYKLQQILGVITLAAGLLAFPGMATAAERELTVDELSVVKLTVKAVPGARSAGTLGAQREGTGVVIDSSGLVLTIGHLITEADTVELSVADGRKFAANVIGFDNATGLGLVKSLQPLPVKPVDFGQSSVANLRDIVLIVGFDGVAPAYIVSKRPFVGYWEYLLDEAIYTAPATVNWQGAALLSRDGKLLGIGSLAVADAVGRSTVPGNMFVPIDTQKPVLGDFIANGRATTKPRPWLGITSQEIQGKVIITRVSAEGPAEEAGLQAGDIIVGMGGQALTGQADFYTRLWKTGDAGVEVTLDVLKGTKIEPVKVKSIAREGHLRSKPVY